MSENQEDVLTTIHDAEGIRGIRLYASQAVTVSPVGSSGRMPRQKPGRSKQDYGTPNAFLEAVQQKLSHKFVWDLAASHENAICTNYFTEGENSLVQDWHSINGWLWLNPPFEDIYPWVQKAALEAKMGAHIAMLVPLSIAKWWTDWVDGEAFVFLLHGRLTFVGETKPYPKDCALLLYTPSGMTGYKVWEWRD